MKMVRTREVKAKRFERVSASVSRNDCSHPAKDSLAKAPRKILVESLEVSTGVFVAGLMESHFQELAAHRQRVACSASKSVQAP